jgi:hypothetical protein
VNETRQSTSEVTPLHYGPVYGDRLLPRGDSLAACRPGPKPGSLTTHKPWVTCVPCKQTEAYRNGR